MTLKYFSLRPRLDLTGKLNVCSDENQEDCVPAWLAEKSLDTFETLLKLLQEQSVQVKCSLNETEIRADMSIAELVQKLEEGHSQGTQEPWVDILSALVTVLAKNPHLGILVSKDETSGSTSLLYVDPPIDWSCWLSTRWTVMANIAFWTLYLGALAGFISLISYLGFRFYKHRAEMKLREQQDIFELVEQVLSLLVKHHHHLSMAADSSVRASLPINHIRDQLIAPPDRKRKRHLWDKVVGYIHHSESRVREDVQLVYGEEHKVWQWIPEVNWNAVSHPGPHPYVAPLHVMPPATPTSSPMRGGSAMASPLTVNSPSTPASGSRWQGSAFNSLNRHVAAPLYAPSSCLKVRHLFDRNMMGKKDWVKYVSEEILQRCHPAGVCHIAVDKESPEGCVYIKAINVAEAAKVFKTLHGQWYRGNLVTAKYLRDERYYEKFKEAKNYLTPMRPTTLSP